MFFIKEFVNISKKKNKYWIVKVNKERREILLEK